MDHRDPPPSSSSPRRRGLIDKNTSGKNSGSVISTQALDNIQVFCHRPVFSRYSEPLPPLSKVFLTLSGLLSFFGCPCLTSTACALACKVLRQLAGHRHRWDPATNATTFSQPSCDALPQLPHRGPRQHRIRSPPLHDSESQRYSIRVSLAESVEAVCQPWPCVEPQRFGWIVA